MFFKILWVLSVDSLSLQLLGSEDLLLHQKAWNGPQGLYLAPQECIWTLIPKHPEPQMPVFWAPAARPSPWASFSFRSQRPLCSWASCHFAHCLSAPWAYLVSTDMFTHGLYLWDFCPMPTVPGNILFDPCVPICIQLQSPTTWPHLPRLDANVFIIPWTPGFF